MLTVLFWIGVGVLALAAVIYLAARIRRAIEGPPDWDDHPRNWW
jgi:hypothetical protein